jgi:hypothetical protein
VVDYSSVMIAGIVNCEDGMTKTINSACLVSSYVLFLSHLVQLPTMIR